MEPGLYDLGGQKVTVSETEARLQSNGALAGSILRMDEAVANMYRFSGCSMAEALQMATLNPANLLDLSNKGRISIKADADLVALDGALRAKMCIRSGQLIFKA